MTSSLPGLAEMFQAASGPGRDLPPVHLWNPPSCGDIDIRIRKDGVWLHEGSPIGRPELVRLFSSVLRKDEDGLCLVTPAEKLRIVVEDAPFTAVGVERRGDAIRFITNVGDLIEAGPDHAVRVETRPDGEPRPYLHVRRGLEALILRSAFYDLVAMAEPRETPGGVRLMAASRGTWFDLGPLEAA